MANGPLALVAPELSDEQRTQLAMTFGVPDVSEVDAELLEPTDAASLYHELGKTLTKAAVVYSAIIEPVRQLREGCHKRVLRAIADNKGKRLAHGRLRIEMKQDEDYTKYIDELVELRHFVDKKTFDKCVYISGVKKTKTSVVTPELLALLRECGWELEWQAHAGHLNKLVADYGEESEIGKIVRKGCKLEPKGQPRLIIEELETEMKRVS